MIFPTIRICIWFTAIALTGLLVYFWLQDMREVPSAVQQTTASAGYVFLLIGAYVAARGLTESLKEFEVVANRS